MQHTGKTEMIHRLMSLNESLTNQQIIKEMKDKFTIDVDCKQASAGRISYFKKIGKKAAKISMRGRPRTINTPIANGHTDIYKDFVSACVRDKLDEIITAFLEKR